MRDGCIVRMMEPMTTLSELMRDDCLWPCWQVAPRVHALVTTRNGGVSAPPYGRWTGAAESVGGLNLGRHTGDALMCVEANRARLLTLTQQPGIAWLNQVHGVEIARADAVIARNPYHPDTAIEADASVTDVPGAVCAVMVADCLPVLLCDSAGRAVGAAHAGWRGLAAGIVETTAARVAELAGGEAGEVHAYLGPAIGSHAYEVGEDVRAAFQHAALRSEQAGVARAFVPRLARRGKYWADMFALARMRLARASVTQISGGDICTFTERERWYSYRRDGVTGRMAALIWLAD